MFWIVYIHINNVCIYTLIMLCVFTHLGSLGVDVALWGHEHIYERLWPVYDYKVMNGTNPYHNTLAPVHIISGAAVRPLSSSMCVHLY